MSNNSRNESDPKLSIRPVFYSFFAILGLILLTISYRITIYSADGSILHSPLKIFRVLLAFVQKQKELDFLLYASGIFFLSINFAPKKIKKIIYCIFLGIAYVLILYRVFNLAHVYYTGGHIEKDFISHIEKSSLSLLSDLKSVFLFIIPIPFVVAIFFILRRLDYSPYPFGSRLLVFLALSLIFYLSAYAIKLDRNSLTMTLWMSEFSYYHRAATSSPEQTLLASLRSENELEDVKKTSGDTRNSLSPTLEKKLKLFGINFNTKEKFPLYRTYVFKKPFPYPKNRGNTTTPNVIIFAMESLSARLLGIYGNNYKDISPNIDSFAKESLVVGPFFNSSLPTINGLASLLCSHYPAYGHEDWTDAKDIIKFNLLCLPEVLKARGYSSYDITAGDPYFAKQSPFLKSNGMDEVWGALEIKQFLNEEPLGSIFKGNSYSDRQVIRFLTESLRKGVFKEPFSVTISTTDMHPPFRLPGDCKLYPDKNNSILSLVYNSDDAFGTFWKYFKDSSYAVNTIVILTADHAMFPGTEYKDLIGKNTEIGFYDEIPFIIHDPTHKLPDRLTVTSTSVDVLPSLLHLLNMNIPNPFEGLSVFESGRRNSPNVLGSHPYYFYYRLNNKNFFFTPQEIDCPEQMGIQLNTTKDNFTACDYLSWWKYKRWLVKNNLIWKNR